MGAQEKVPKEKGDPVHSSAAPMPCVPRPSGGAHNSAGKPASDRVRALVPDGLRYSVSADGNRADILGVDLDPSGAAEHRRENRSKLAPCLSAASCASAGFHEKRREPAQRASLRERLSFGYFSLAEQRKVPRPTGRNRMLKEATRTKSETGC